MATARNFQARPAFVSGSANSWPEILEKENNLSGLILLTEAQECDGQAQMFFRFAR